MDNILGRGHETHLPGMDSTADMLNAFSNCFNDKVLKIRESLNVTVLTDSQILSKHHLSTFKESTEDEVRHGDHEISNKVVHAGSDHDTCTQREKLSARWCWILCLSRRNVGARL